MMRIHMRSQMRIMTTRTLLTPHLESIMTVTKMISRRLSLEKN